MVGFGIIVKMPRNRLIKTESLLIDHINRSGEFVQRLDYKKAERHYRRAEILLQNLYMTAKEVDLYNEIETRLDNYRDVLTDIIRVICLQQSFELFPERVTKPTLIERYRLMSSAKQNSK